MNMKTLLAVALCAGLVSTGVWAKDGKKGDRKDGKRHKAEKRFDKVDTNNNGSISKDEYIAFCKERHGKDKKKDK